MTEEQLKSIADTVRAEYSKGNIVFWDCDNNLFTANLQDFMKQPVDWMLYDLNRSEEVILTFIDNPKWVNDYAMCKIVRELYKRIEELEKNKSQTERSNNEKN